MINLSYAIVNNDIDAVVSVSHVVDNKRAYILLCV